MKKICFYITTRGNYAKTKSVIDALRGYPDVEIQYITGGNCPEMEFYGKHSYSWFGNNTQYKVGDIAHRITWTMSHVLDDFSPDVLVIVGDRFECLPMAMMAFYQGIQIAHLEGGELSGSIDEGIRHAITKLASVHFPCTEGAREIILQLGENPEAVFNVGGTSMDVLEEYSKGTPLVKPPYVLLTLHPVAWTQEDVECLVQAIKLIDTQVVRIRPNIDIGSLEFEKELTSLLDCVTFDGLKIEEYAPLMKNASVIIGNSSSGIRESAFLGVPSVNVGDRQEGRELPESVLSVPFDALEITIAIQSQLEMREYPPDYTYGDGDAGRQIAKILAERDFDVQKRFYREEGICT